MFISSKELEKLKNDSFELSFVKAECESLARRISVQNEKIELLSRHAGLKFEAGKMRLVVREGV